MSELPWQGSSTDNSAQEEIGSGIPINKKKTPLVYSKEKLVFTQEELRVIQECNRESFYYRCLPLGVIFVGATHMLTSKGILKPHPRFGSLFKNLGASLAAYLLGNLSYQSICKEKIMRLPNSALAESMRKGGPFEINWRESLQQCYIDSFSNFQFREKSQDMYKPSSDFKEYDEPQQKRSDSPGGYDALRQQNRQEYDRRRNYQQPTKPAEPQQNQKPIEDESKRVKRNKYGDVVD